jgi:drug/metabolite transporter (DMT)-like permease
MGSTVLGAALACIASCLFNAAIAVQAVEARQVSAQYGLRITLLRRLIKRRRWLGATLLGALAAPTQTAALFFAPLTVVQPCDAAGLLLLLYLGTRLLNERVGRREVLAVVGIIAGIVILTVSAPRRQVTHVDAADVLIPLLVVAAIGLAPFALRRLVGPDSLLTVFGAGFAFALSAFAIKLVADAIDRHTWGVLVFVLAVAAAGALVGTLSEQSALQRRQATQVAPIIFVVEMLVPVGLAVTVVGESWSGSTVPIAAALALVVAGVVALTRAPQVAGMIGSG